MPRSKQVHFNIELLHKHFETITDYAKGTDITFSQASSHWKGTHTPVIKQLCKITDITGTKLDDWISYE